MDADSHGYEGQAPNSSLGGSPSASRIPVSIGVHPWFNLIFLHVSGLPQLTPWSIRGGGTSDDPRVPGGFEAEVPGGEVVVQSETEAVRRDRRQVVAAGAHAEGDVGVALAKLKAAGFTSGYLKPIVVARVNPLRFVKPGKDDRPDFDKTIDKMIEGAKKFDPSKVRAQDVAIAAAVGGGGGGEE